MRKILVVFTISVLLLNVNASMGMEVMKHLFSDPETVIGSTTVRVSEGSPFSFKITDEGNEDLPYRIVIWNAVGNGTFSIVNLSNRSEVIYPFVSNYTRDLQFKLDYAKPDEHYYIYSRNYSRNSEYLSEYLLVVNISSSEQAPWVIYLPAFVNDDLFAIYYDGSGNAKLQMRVERSNRYAHPFPEQQLSLQSGEHFSSIGKVNATPILSVDLKNVIGQGTLRVFLFTDSRQQVYSDYNRYFETYANASVSYNQMQQYYSYNIPHQSHEHIMVYKEVQLNGSMDLLSVIESYSFLVGDVYFSGLKYPMPDENPDEFLFAIYFEGGGTANFNLEVKYPVTTHWVVELGSLNDLEPVEKTTESKTPFSLLFLFMAVPVILIGKKRRQFLKQKL